MFLPTPSSLWNNLNTNNRNEKTNKKNKETTQTIMYVIQYSRGLLHCECQIYCLSSLKADNVCVSSLGTPMSSGDGITPRGNFHLNIFCSLKLQRNQIIQNVRKLTTKYKDFGQTIFNLFEALIEASESIWWSLIVVCRKSGEWQKAIKVSYDARPKIQTVCQWTT